MESVACDVFAVDGNKIVQKPEINWNFPEQE